MKNAILSCTTKFAKFKILSDYNMAEYIAESKPLGGLLFLLPQMFHFENKGGMGSNHLDGSKELLKNVLAELEQILIHINLPVSKFQKASPISRLLSLLLSFGEFHIKIRCLPSGSGLEKVN